MTARMLLVALAVLSTLASAASAQTPAPGDLVINEILYDPPTGGSGNEWIEVYNRSAQTFDMQGAIVTDSRSSSSPVAESVTIAPGGYVVLASDAAAFAATYPSVPFVALNIPALNNTGDRPALVFGTTEIDAVPYEAAWGGTDASLERRDPFGPSDAASNFGTTTGAPEGTPGTQNSLFASDTEPPQIDAVETIDALTLRVAFSEPVGAGADQASNYAVDPTIGAPTSARVTSNPAEVELALGTPLTGPATYTLTVRNVADLRGNAITTETAPFFFGQGAEAAPRDLVLNEFLYDEPTANNPGEFVELFNRTDQAFDLRDFTLNDGTGADEPVTTSPIFIGPGEFAVIVEDAALFQAVFPSVPFVEQPAWSALNNTGDDIVLKYRGVTIDSLRYTAAWGGLDVSLERKDPDGASVQSNFVSSTDPRGGTPGAQNSQFAPDVAGPRLVSAVASVDGRAVTVTLDEPAAPASLSAASFALSGATVTDASYDGDVTVALALGAPLTTGTYTVTASGVTDLLGNTTDQSSVSFDFVADETAPALASATATSATTVEVTFTEPVTVESAGATDTYTVSDGIGTPAAVDVVFGSGAAIGATLTFASPLQDRFVYTLNASGLVDRAGNAGEGTASLFFGQADVAQPGEIVIHEVMYDPQNGSDGEYIEIVNATADRIFDLRAVTLNGDAIANTATVLVPGQILAVVQDAEAFTAVFPGAAFFEAADLDGLSNSGEAVVLRAGGVTIDSVQYDPDWHRPELDDATGIALERRDVAGPSNDASNWSSSLDERGGTPSAPNSVGVAGGEPPAGVGIEITGPFDPETESAKIFYSLGAEASLIRIRIYDAGGRFVRELLPGRLTGREGSQLWDGRGEGGERLRVGYYVVLVEAIDVQGGTTEAYKATVVLARR